MQLSAKQFYANAAVDDEQTDTDARMDDSKAADGAMTPSIEVSQWVNEHGGLDSIKKLVNEERRMRLYLRDIAKAVGVAENGQIWIDAILEALGKRLMPEGMEWPRFETGEQVKFGDEVHVENERPYPNFNIVVDRISFDKAGFIELFDDSNSEVEYRSGERVKRAEPTDTWERIEEDASKNPFDYCKDVGHHFDTCENAERYKARDLVRRAKLQYLGRINESTA